MKTTDFITESHHIVDSASAMHSDHEIQMAREECYHAASNAIELHRMLKKVSEQRGLEAWATEKITLANDYLRTVKEWLEYEMMSDVESHLPIDQVFSEDAGSTGSSSIATSMGGGNGFANGGPGTIARPKLTKKKIKQ